MSTTRTIRGGPTARVATLATLLCLAAGSASSPRAQGAPAIQASPADWVALISLGSVPPDWLAPDSDGLQRRLARLKEDLYSVGPPDRIRAAESTSPGESTFDVVHLHASAILRWRLRFGSSGRLLDADVDLARPVAPGGFEVRLSGDLFISRAGDAEHTFEAIGPGIGPGGGAVRAVDTPSLVDYLTTLRTAGDPLEDMKAWWPALDGVDHAVVEAAWEWSLRVSAGNWGSNRLSPALAATSSSLSLPVQWRELIAERGPPGELILKSLGARPAGQLLQFLTRHPTSGQRLYWELGFFDLGREGIFRLDVRGGGFPKPAPEPSDQGRPPPTGPAPSEDSGDRSDCIRVTWWPRLEEACRPGDIGVETTHEVVFEVFNACKESVLIDVWLLTGYTTKVDRARLRKPGPSPLREAAWEGSTFANTRLAPFERAQRTVCNWLGRHAVAAAAERLDDRQIIGLEACPEAGDRGSAVADWRRLDLLPARRLLLRDCNLSPRAHYVRALP